MTVMHFKHGLLFAISIPLWILLLNLWTPLLYLMTPMQLLGHPWLLVLAFGDSDSAVYRTFWKFLEGYIVEGHRILWNLMEGHRRFWNILHDSCCADIATFSCI